MGRSFVMTVDSGNTANVIKQIRQNYKLKDGDVIRVTVEKVSVGKGVKI